MAIAVFHYDFVFYMRDSRAKGKELDAGPSLHQILEHLLLIFFVSPLSFTMGTDVSIVRCED
jgi:hypothetical protein